MLILAFNSTYAINGGFGRFWEVCSINQLKINKNIDQLLALTTSYDVSA
jgi:hypothetical protein